MEEEHVKKRKKTYLTYIAVIAVILVVVILAFAFGQKGKKEEEVAGAVGSALEGTSEEEKGEAQSEEVVSGGVTSVDAEKATTTTTLKPQITLAIQSNIIKKIIELREYSNKNNLVKTAEVVTELNEQFTAANVDVVEFSWHDMVDCVYEKCDDRKYFNLIDVVVLQNFDNDRNKLIHYVIEAYNLWTGRNIILWSETVAKVNKLVEDIDNPAITSKWNKVVECNAECDEFSDLVVDLIKEIDSA